MKLYTYFRSSAAYRVRIALHIKDVDFDTLGVHLLRDGGEQHTEHYRKLNPQARVPTLVHGEYVLTQSLAQLEYLEEHLPGPALLPASPQARARVRSLAYVIACDIHPLQNLSVLNYLDDELEASDEQRKQWCQHWIGRGLDAFEELVARDAQTGRCCHGDCPTLADICLIPQLYNARRFECGVGRWPTIERIEAHCLSLKPFSDAHPERQPDTPEQLRAQD
ncbi:MAG: maleylacetoacetate isomerase [Proteobacteria bacterium]|nr:maleylacetoacetate isomerase [Pseudomonadota bacterium]